VQDQLHKAEGLKDFKVAASVYDNMRPLSAELLKGDRLTCLVGKSTPGLCIRKEMVQAVTPMGKPPPLAVRLEKALPFRR
jgi:hypothetical protein